MCNQLVRLWIRARLALRARGATERDRIVISPDARVSLDQNGAVFLQARSGVIFTSNRIGARIWQGLRDRESVEAIAARISGESGALHNQVRQDTARFVVELETQGFLSRRIGC
jgi:hypothetical protein